jgi:hypothetical protein
MSARAAWVRPWWLYQESWMLYQESWMLYQESWRLYHGETECVPQ